MKIKEYETISTTYVKEIEVDVLAEFGFVGGEEQFQKMYYDGTLAVEIMDKISDLLSDADSEEVGTECTGTDTEIEID